MKILLFFCFLSSAVQSEVVSSSPLGFKLNIVKTVNVNSKEAYAQFIKVGEWWNAQHTYFGNSKNLSIEAKAGGCFCEKLDGKEVLHMTVTYVDPGNEIRMTGGLGPLQMMGAQGGMSWKFIPINDNQTTIIHHYQVSGYSKEGLESLAPIVDKVQTQQVENLVSKIQQSSKITN